MAWAWAIFGGRDKISGVIAAQSLARLSSFGPTDLANIS